MSDVSPKEIFINVVEAGGAVIAEGKPVTELAEVPSMDRGSAWRDGADRARGSLSMWLARTGSPPSRSCQEESERAHRPLGAQGDDPDSPGHQPARPGPADARIPRRIAISPGLRAAFKM